MARPPRLSGNLPAEATSFIGRRRELADVRRKLAEARLVSLVGPGGVGKTRLAIRIATGLGRTFPDGTWLAELADVRDPARAGDAVTAALDLRDQAAEPLPHLLSYLREKRLLLVVDNCEHLLDPVARLVTEILKAAPGIRILTTSREPLSAPGEHVVPVPPLELPPPGPGEPLARIRQNEAVMLFAERAAAGSGAFELTAANQQAVVALCRRLDGLPLAIELAAVRTRVLTAEQILDRLSDRFGLLTGGGRAALPRHQTLRTTIDWSHDLLEADEQALLRRLCVFAGRFTLEDIESVCASGDVPAAGVLDLLSSLVGKSLVMKEDLAGLACYHLHETIREYARLKLRAAGEEEAVERGCAEYYEARCRRSAGEARYRLVEWLDWMDLEIDNIRAVLRRCLHRRDLRRGIALTYSLGWYWMTRATSEGVRWLDELLASAGDDARTISSVRAGDARGSSSARAGDARGRSSPDAGDPRERSSPCARDLRAYAQACYLRGFLAVLQTDPAAARPALDRAITSARQTELLSLLSQSLSLASIAANMAGDRASATRLSAEARAVPTTPDDLPARLMSLQSRALNGLFDGDLDTARSAASEGVRLSRGAGDLYSLGMMLLNLGSASLIAGDLDGSKPLLAEALRIAHRIDDRVAQYCLLDALGCQAASSGRARLAAHLLGAAETVRTGAGASLLPFLVPLVRRAVESATAALGEEGFEAESETGKRLSMDAAIGLALGEPNRDIAPAPADAGAAPLGKREAEVARLVADGLGNKQIAARLFISEHTVDSHIRNIMNKLGFSSRTQIAAWMASSGARVR
ncbi:LuxR C-terminal-related transcriptional regulator [Nonomuraea sp. SYSU D8015]|uniref:LuxR C-terminal-related transcriptional regulator n=1 Tax=Nonomuraea sp. SYSU D8015 TaxID=2593644 RepID=UPI0016611A46|nr:LuxR C-terminal-related transcriptional regulator [Nonomuraea sp. SYSU D8015]